jgi:hypothetical protein
MFGRQNERSQQENCREWRLDDNALRSSVRRLNFSHRAQGPNTFWKVRL